jgi:hypothetical protein
MLTIKQPTRPTGSNGFIQRWHRVQKEALVEILDLGQVARSQTFAAHSNHIQTTERGSVTLSDTKVRHILNNNRSSRNHRHIANAAELMNARDTTNHGAVVDLHMTRQLNRIGKNVVVTDQAVVSNMRVRHKQIVIADDCLSAALNSSGLQCCTLTNFIPMTNGQSRRLAFVLQILRDSPDARKWEDFVFLANRRVTIKNNMRDESGSTPDLHVATHCAVGPDNNVGINLRT